jgi:Conjugal transfer protein
MKLRIGLLLFPALLAAQEVHTARIIHEHDGQMDEIHCPALMECSIEAPKGELFKSATIGDDAHWYGSDQTLAAAPSRFYSFKTGFGGMKTTLHLVTDHQHQYGFMLIESRVNPDYTVILKADDVQLQQEIAAPLPTVPREQYDALRAELAAVQKQLTTTREQTNERVTEAQVTAEKHAVGQLRRYQFDQKLAAGKPWMVSDILAGEHSTYIKRPANAPDLPTVVALGIDGKPDVVVPHYNSEMGMYEISQRIEAGYLTNGAKKHEKRLPFQLSAEIASR